MNIKIITRTLLLCLLIITGSSYAVDFTVPSNAYSSIRSTPKPLNETTYRQFQAIQKQIDAKQYDNAFNALTHLAQRYQKHPYVVSVAMKTAAYIYIAQQRYPSAIIWLQRTLDLSVLPPKELQTIRHDLSQLQLQDHRYQEAIITMKAWLKEAQPSQISPADYQLIAASQFHLKQYPQAIQTARQGIKLTGQPHEPLYQVILSSEIALNDYVAADDTLSTLVTLAPSRKYYWLQWVSVLEQQGRGDRALAILELMDKRQMLSTEQERIHYIQRLIQQNNAFEAANRLHQYLSDKQVLTSLKNQLLLASAWELGGESNNAIAVLEQQMISQPSNEVLTQLVRIYVKVEKWQTLTTLLENNLDQPVTKKNEQLYFQLGYAYYQLGTQNSARKTFQLIAQSEKSSQKARKSAKQWLAYIH